ncbi:uncharacterized protein LOC129909308 [Episyrphus balteatus]|uniref:uncharacterized protein LOC129909308 n=1 Tax=Episyrphus balteatus TaxID=286459 RepID=UPI002485A799|nr:uncharacterized protein LOC129909308 [Episyrphus balteatus]
MIAPADGFEIVEESTLKLSNLINYLQDSPLTNMYKLDLNNPTTEELTSKEITHICQSLEKLLLEDLTYDQLTGLFVASSITYLLSRSFQDFESRTELLHKTFRYSNSLDPLHLHIAAKSLHSNINSKSNLLFLCKNICFTSDTGNAISMCLVWAMFLETLDKEIEMYCFHPLSYIQELVADADINQMLNRKETSAKAYFLFQLMSILVSSIISRSNEELKKAGYAEYFKYDLSDIHSLRDWAQKINQNIILSFNATNTNYDLIMMIKETITYNIVALLDDKLKTIDGGH